jgi:hypothetical protein
MLCAALPSGDTSPAAMPRALRYPWQGGFVALARAAGVERIEPGCAPQLSRTCTAFSCDRSRRSCDPYKAAVLAA